MSLIVQKFGGTSVKDAQRIRNVAGIIAETYLQGNDVIVVLSAQGDTTDDLIAKAEEINPHASKREMDMLLSTGEVMFYGKGAGEMPTASACVADGMECLQASPKREEIGWSPDTNGFEDPMELHTRYYFRIEGSLTDAALAFGQVEVLSEDGETAFLTDRISGQDAQQQSRCLNVLACMRVLA